MHLPGTILIFMEVMGVQSFIYLIVLSTATIHQTHMDQASLGRQNSPTSQATSRHYFLPGIRARPRTKLTHISTLYFVLNQRQSLPNNKANWVSVVRHHGSFSKRPLGLNDINPHSLF